MIGFIILMGAVSGTAIALSLMFLLISWLDDSDIDVINRKKLIIMLLIATPIFAGFLYLARELPDDRIEIQSCCKCEDQ